MSLAHPVRLCVAVAFQAMAAKRWLIKGQPGLGSRVGKIE
jgi:hypothetical protein